MTLPIKTAYETMLRTLSPQERPMVTDILRFDDYLERIATVGLAIILIFHLSFVSALINSSRPGGVRQSSTSPMTSPVLSTRRRKVR